MQAMFSTILLSLVPSLVPALPATSTSALVRPQEDEVAAKIAACGEDVAKLEALAASYEAAEDKASARSCYERILELDDAHVAAHKALRHHEYDGKWFTSYASLSKYRREEATRMKEEFGLVRHNDEWVPEADLPYIRMGWEKVGDTYVNPAIEARSKEREEHVAMGHELRPEDSTWIAPEDFDKWRSQLFKVGEDWVTKAEANAHHAKVESPWRHQGEHFVAVTTCDVDTAGWVRYYADGTYDDLVRLFGVHPEEKPVFACLNTLEQYNSFAAGDQATRPQTESTGFSSCYFAFLGDVWFDFSNPQLPEYLGGGVGFFDVNDETMKHWGQYSVRHAAGLSFVESIDRAWGTISQFLTGGGGGGVSPDQMWEEKRIPKWLVYGAAAYVERFYEVKGETDDPWEIQVWAMGQISNSGHGKLDPIEEIFALPLDLNDLDNSGRLIQQTGLLTAFLLDGGCKPVAEAHRTFKAKLKSGGSTKEEVAALQQAILDNQAALVKFCGIPVITPEERSAARAASAPAESTDGADAAGAAGAAGSTGGTGSTDGSGGSGN